MFVLGLSNSSFERLQRSAPCAAKGMWCEQAPSTHGMLFQGGKDAYLLLHVRSCADGFRVKGEKTCLQNHFGDG